MQATSQKCHKSPDRKPVEALSSRITAAAAPTVPDALAEQLADDGRLVIPVGGRWEQDLTLIERRGAALTTSKHGPCVFVPLRGAAGWT